jgi:hypothetical protein
MPIYIRICSPRTEEAYDDLEDLYFDQLYTEEYKDNEVNSPDKT